MKLLISMGIPVKNYDSTGYGRRYHRAILQIIDWERRVILQEIEYVPERADRWPDVSVLFKGAILHGDECWVVTNTEIVVYDSTSWKIRKIMTHPTFNDLHGVAPFDDGYYVCNTGLEIVQQFDNEDNLLAYTNIALTPTTDRFDLQADYRNVASTKPHSVHPNHVFFVDGEPWVNRCKLQDAAKLSDMQQSTEKLPAGCHDGLVVGDHTYFTTINGHVCAVDHRTNRVDLDLDVNEANDSGMVVGWMRGLCIDGDRGFVGNTALRESKSVEFAKWIKRRAGGTVRMGSAIVEIDLAERRVVDVYELRKRPGAAIYSIIQL